MNWFLVFFALILCGLQQVTAEPAALKGSSYLVSFENEHIFDKCEMHPDNFITKGFDISNIKYEVLDDDTIQVSGSITFLLDLMPNQKVVSEAHVFQKSKGEWIGTMYNIRRIDTCLAIHNPGEMWHPYTKVIAPELTPCPPKKGTVFNVNVKASPIISGIQNQHADGDYKAEVTIVYGPRPKDYMCFELRFRAMKI